jgi:tRNA(Ile)-lysidine synthase
MGTPQTQPACPTLLARFAEEWPASFWGGLPILVAVSGGLDSVALLGLMLASPLPEGQLTVAHINHGQRGWESLEDAGFVCELASRLGVECRVETDACVGPDADRSEAALRRRRYALLLRTAEAGGARYLVTGHTADDQAETVIHHVLRGSGMLGLAGIPRVRRLSESVTLIRPLLSYRRRELEEYLSGLGQTWRMDSTNADRRFLRNRFRHELLPLLSQACGRDVVPPLVRLARMAREAHDELELLVEPLLERCVKRTVGGGMEIETRGLQFHSPVLVRQLLRAVWRRNALPMQNMAFAHWQRLAEAVIEDRSQTLVLPGNVTAACGSGRVHLSWPLASHQRRQP